MSFLSVVLQSISDMPSVMQCVIDGKIDGMAGKAGEVAAAAPAGRDDSGASSAQSGVPSAAVSEARVRPREVRSVYIFGSCSLDPFHLPLCRSNFPAMTAAIFCVYRGWPLPLCDCGFLPSAKWGCSRCHCVILSGSSYAFAVPGRY